MSTTIELFDGNFDVTVNGSRTYGQYLTGDDRMYCVIPEGGVEVEGITVGNGTRAAGSIAGRDGAMIDPAHIAEQGYDDRFPTFYGPSYNSSKNKVHGGFPFLVTPGQSLVVSESAIDPLRYYPGFGIPVWLERAAVLHFVSEAPPANSFAPHYSSATKTHYNWSQVNQTPIPDWGTVTGIPTIASLLGSVNRVQLDHCPAWVGRMMHPYVNFANGATTFGRDLCDAWGKAMCLCLIDEGVTGDRTALLRHLIQLGIDLYGLRLSGGYWSGMGGSHGQGRKAPILFADAILAGALLDGASIGLGFDEDAQTFYVSQTDVDRVHYPQRTGYTSDPATADYVSGDIGTAEWGQYHSSNPIRDDKSLGATYRTGNGNYWMAHALAVCALSKQSAWGHQVYFDYVERYRASIGTAPNTFVQNLMTAHWGDVYSPPPPPAPHLVVRKSKVLA